MAVFLHRMGIKWTFAHIGAAPNMPWRAKGFAVCGSCEGADGGNARSNICFTNRLRAWEFRALRSAEYPSPLTGLGTPEGPFLRKKGPSPKKRLGRAGSAIGLPKIKERTPHRLFCENASRCSLSHCLWQCEYLPKNPPHCALLLLFVVRSS